MYVVWGIAGVGVVLIAGVLLWGARIRRRARNERLEPQPHDPLWYLKTNKKKPEPEQNPEPAGDTD